MSAHLGRLVIKAILDLQVPREQLANQGRLAFEEVLVHLETQDR